MDKKKETICVSPNEINPVDHYNINHVQDAFNLLVNMPSVEKNGVNSFAFVKNKSDRKKQMIVVEDGVFVAKLSNGFNIRVGEKLTPFMIIQRCVFKESFRAALSYVIYDIMHNTVDYIRVGIKYYKISEKIDRNSIARTELKNWDKPTIVSDHGKDFIDKIECFDDFTLHPNNKNYQSIVNNNYNLYAPFEHKPMKANEYKGELDWYWTHTLLNHIFGKQYELGIKYMKVLYDLPMQKLPILVLVSKERSTGKTTYVDFIELLFGANTVIINPQDIGNQFNGAYADKNIIMIEESRFKGKQEMEKLKNLNTQKKILVNTKFIQHFSIPFHGKIIITSNDENKFSIIDDTEIRYWVRKIPTLKGIANHNILNDLRKEIPAFLYYLSTLEEITNEKSRMVFTPEELNTSALEMVKKESKTSLSKEIEILLEDFFVQNPSIEEVKFSLVDIKEQWFKHDHNYDRPWLKAVLRDEFKLTPEHVQRYEPFQTRPTSVTSNTKTGRPYVIKNPHYETDDDLLKQMDNE